jgi:hypothetical protein
MTFSVELTKKDDVDEIRKLYFMYPDGRFLKVPMGKRDQSSMFIITNTYEPTTIYYHEDMISMIRHHNLNTRRVTTYQNPVSGTYDGFISTKEIAEIASSANIELPHNAEPLSLTKYCCGMDWDHRAMIYIISMYMNYNKIKLVPSSLKRLIIIPYLTMDLNTEQVSTRVDFDNFLNEAANP